jgi:hypothetical protein
MSWQRSAACAATKGAKRRVEKMAREVKVIFLVGGRRRRCSLDGSFNTPPRNHVLGCGRRKKAQGPGAVGIIQSQGRRKAGQDH